MTYLCFNMSYVAYKQQYIRMYHFYNNTLHIRKKLCYKVRQAQMNCA